MSSSTVLSLKRKALEHKRAGDIEAAKRVLSQARVVESLNLEDPDDLRKMAAILKQHGDIEGAKEALGKAKKLQQEAKQQPSSAEASSNEQDKFAEDPVNKAIDDANLEELATATVKFTDEEMIDVTTMADLKSAGMDIPSREEYQARVTACKRAALKAKNNKDVTAAKRHLMTAKQLEKAIETLFLSGEGGLDEEVNDEDYSLLDELMENGGSKPQEDDGFFEQLFGKSATVLELDDLDDLDPAMLRDLMESGMEIPDVDKVLETAKEKKAAAIQFKKSGDLASAKAALEESKRLESRATQLSDMLKAIESGACDEAQNLDPEAMLEAMLEASEGGAQQPKKADAPPPAASPEKLKSSDEYKVLAVKLKKDGRLQEAVAALRLYKQAVAADKSAKVAEQRKECIVALRKETQMAAEQTRLFTFYNRFVDHELGGTQLKSWKEYARQCTTQLDKIGGGEPIPLGRTTTSDLKVIGEEDWALVGKSCNPLEARIEVSVMDIFDLHTNKHLRRVLGVTKDFNGEIKMPTAAAIRVHVTVQLPPSMEAPDDNVLLYYEPTSQVEGRYVFGDSQYVNAERGSSRFAKLLVRRMARRRIIMQVFHLTTKKTLFSSSTEETLLGSASIELKGMLQRNAIAGDFPLLDATRRHELGGRMRCAIRTGRPFVETKVDEQEQPVTAMTGLSQAVVDVKEYSPFSLE